MSSARIARTGKPYCVCLACGRIGPIAHALMLAKGDTVAGLSRLPEMLDDTVLLLCVLFLLPAAILLLGTPVALLVKLAIAIVGRL